MMKIWFNNMIQKKSQKWKSAYAISKELKPQEIKYFQQLFTADKYSNFYKLFNFLALK